MNAATPEPIDVAELDALRTRMLHCVRQASSSLSWFARQVDSGGIPFNIWRRFDRPLPRDAKTAGLAFEVWHAMLRAERTLRLWAPETAKELGTEASTLKNTLNEYITDPEQPPSVHARRLISDELYGTFNALSAASVLRSEVFPERANSTPSYVAGHVLVSELKSASNEARAHSISGIRERSPRLYVVAQGVHSLMLYVEQLRKRAACFTELSDELEALKNFDKATEAHEPSITDGYLRLAATRMASLCGECDLLLLSTRPFFQAWCKSLGALARKSPECVAMADFESTFASAVLSLSDNHLDGCYNPQVKAFDEAIAFCYGLWQRVSNVHESLKEVFSVLPHQGYTVLIERIGALKGHLEGLEKLHLADTQPGEFPSILDAARFQFANMLVSRFCDDQGALLTSGHDLLAENLKRLRQVYEPTLDSERSSTHRDACRIVGELGNSAIGRGVLEWWKNYAQCYECPSPDQYGDEPKDFPERNVAWMSLRHRSFHAARTLTRQIAGFKDSWRNLIVPLHEAASEQRAIAENLLTLIKDLTQWCSSRGHRLVLSGRKGMSQIADPLELVAALWIADRIGEPWTEELEQDAFDVISSLQHPDGSFGAVAPLFHNRGFTFYLPSASTIALLARFATGGTDAPRRRRLQDRLRRWAPVLIRGASFLTETGVALNGDRGETRINHDFAGWHSDRHIEAERIDCFATTEAVTALCRLDDAFRWLINLEVVKEFRVSWPSKILKHALPMDVESRSHQLLLKIAPLAWELKQLSASYSNSLVSLPERGAGSRSFLFYGPPGTGKTFSQEIIAGELGWPLVTLTIGDFLYYGEDKVGRRAEDIFRRLSFLSNVCVVFDEFDEMVTARSRKGEQGWSGLPLLTATMLPLLSSFRDKLKTRCCTVSFTTNYLENIDPAATRAGRIDQLILLTYADYSSRLLLGVQEAADRSKPVDWNLIRSLARETAICAYPDVRAHIASGIADPAGATRASPKSPIDSAYYGSEKNRPDTPAAVAKLLETVGPPEVLADWLKRPENADWERLYVSIQERGSTKMPERRNCERQRLRGRCKAQIDGHSVKFVDVCEGGFRLEVPAENAAFPDSFSLSVDVSGWPGFGESSLDVAARTVRVWVPDGKDGRRWLCCRVQESSMGLWTRVQRALTADHVP